MPSTTRAANTDPRSPLQIPASRGQRSLRWWWLVCVLLPGCGHVEPPRAATLPAGPATSGTQAPAATTAPVASAAPVEVVLRIATFNIQKLGPTKAGRPEVMAKLAAIVRRYDLVAVQEIVDKAGEVPGRLLDAINAARDPSDASDASNASNADNASNASNARDGDAGGYAMVVSPRTGQQPDDRHSQEQYAYYYRTDRLAPLGQHGLFDDSAHDYFQREPHVARFAVQDTCASFVLMNLHTRPRAAVSEIAAVEHVFAWARARYDDERHFVALGDFNAGCGYASEQDLDALPLHGEQYDWVVPHSADTNLAKAQCPYDRIVIQSTQGNLLVKDWGVDRAFSDRRISDHWPVWASFRFEVDATCERTRTR